MIGLFLIAFGLFMAIFCTIFGRWAVEWNYKMLGIKFSELGYKVSFIIVGSLFIAIGTLVLFGMIKFK